MVQRNYLRVRRSAVYLIKPYRTGNNFILRDITDTSMPGMMRGGAAYSAVAVEPAAGTSTGDGGCEV